MSTITNLKATATQFIRPSDGATVHLGGNASTTVSDADRQALLSDSRQAYRFWEGGDLSITAPTPGPASGATSFSQTIDLTVGATTPLVPGIPGRVWVTRQLRVDLVHADPGVTTASVEISSNGVPGSGVSVDADGVGGFPSPFLSLFPSQSQLAFGLDLQVLTPSTGGACVAAFQVTGEYV